MSVSVETKPETKLETVVTPQVDKHLSELYSQRDESESKTSTLFGEICDHVRKNLCTFGTNERGEQTVVLHPNVRLTLQAPKAEGGRALSKESVSVELSRIKAMMLDKNQGIMNQLVQGLITQADARKLATVKTRAPRASSEPEEKSPTDQYMDALTKLARQVVNNLQSKTEDEFVNDAREAFKAMVAEKATIDAKKASGAITIEGQKPSVPATQGGFDVPSTPANVTPTPVKGGRRAA